MRDIADIERSSNPTDLTTAGATLFFGAQQGSDGGLWRSDGTSAGTLELHGGFEADSYGVPRLLTAVGSRVFFRASDVAHAFELWTSDGTADGTHLVEDLAPGRESSYPNSLIEFGGTLLFAADVGDNVGRFWRSDGTDAVPFSDVFIAGDSMRRVGSQLFFEAYSDAGGELWRSDGTQAGTRLVRDIYPGGEFSRPSDIVALGHRAFFAANDGVHGRELWSSDGTEDGTTLLLDIAPGEPGSDACSLYSASSPQLVAAGASLFFIASDGVHGRELWATNGTPSGTHMVRDLAPGDGDSLECDVSWLPKRGLLADLNGALLFAGKGELWRTDGSESGTVLVRDINPGPQGSMPSDLIALGGILVFTADDGTHGRELWVSDGTEAGTRLAQDIRVGAEPSSPTELTQVDGDVFFSASDGLHGREVWRLPFAALVDPCPCDCNVDGRVTISELVTAVNAVLDATRPSLCAAADSDDSGSVDVADLMSGVSTALGTCRPTVRE